MLMQDASWQNQIVLQWLSNSPTAVHIDMEIGDLKGDNIGGKPLIKYLRYNFPITLNDLNGLGLKGRTFTEKDVPNIVEMSNAGNRHLLYEIGTATAEKNIKKEHFS
jgi:hypothetical protein